MGEWGVFDAKNDKIFIMYFRLEFNLIRTRPLDC